MPTLTELHVYPIKSCAGISLREATLTSAGLMAEHIYDREWMVVDEKGNFLTQRDFPRLALVTPRIKADTLELRAPGMLRLEIPLGLPDPEDAKTMNVRVWDELDSLDDVLQKILTGASRANILKTWVQGRVVHGAK